ncbi:MAG TPA: hypothetical protein PKM58_05990, partial [Pyrinomonadaceae bacterium]|nr:hypothetical protein [Pyrinomonadaceae bacterium]
CQIRQQRGLSHIALSGGVWQNKLLTELTTMGLEQNGFRVFSHCQTPTNDGTDPMIDTSQRIFRRGSILRYGFEVYNAKLDAAKRPQLTFRIRIFRERRLVLDGTETPADLGGQNDFTRVRGSGAVSLAPKMEPGDYVMQVIAYDGLVKPKNRIATQYVQFEVTE